MSLSLHQSSIPAIHPALEDVDVPLASNLGQRDLVARRRSRSFFPIAHEIHGGFLH